MEGQLSFPLLLFPLHMNQLNLIEEPFLCPSPPFIEGQRKSKKRYRTLIVYVAILYSGTLLYQLSICKVTQEIFTL